MKLTTNQLRHLKVIYVYEDGHAILKFEKFDQKAGRIEWVGLVESFGARCYFKGRIIFSGFYEHCNFGLARYILAAEKIEASESGSENTRNKGITVNHCSIQSKEGTIGLSSLPELISGSFTWQPDTEEELGDLNDKFSWAGYNIACRHVDKVAQTV